MNVNEIKTLLRWKTKTESKKLIKNYRKRKPLHKSWLTGLQPHIRFFLDKYVTPILQTSLIGKYENTLEISTSGE